MNNYYKKTIQKLETEIAELTSEFGNSLLFYERSIDLIIQKMMLLKEFLQSNNFNSIEDEINFFKVQKPSVISKLIYFNAIYKIEAKKPYGGKQAIETYLNNEMLELKRFYDKNAEFYKYYRTGSNYLDHKYFVRGEHDIKLSLDTYYFEADHTFSTSHDYKVAKIIANDLIQTYLKKRLANITNGEDTDGLKRDGQSLTWTTNKTDLIELIYALHTQEVFNNGNIDIKVIATCFEQLFNIDLGDFYHTYLELRNRKKNPTKFLDLLRDGLIKKMDAQDEK